ncbi:MAG: spore germination protein [Cyanothece sp. SIO1E1]|nr:spore germination protein [Cyanothece sp. SIO1E1]
MENRQHVHRLPLGVIVGLSAVVLIAGGGTAWWTWSSLTATKEVPITLTKPSAPATKQPSEAPSTQPSAKPTEPSSSQTAIEQTTKVFWLQDTGTRLKLTAKEINLDVRDQPDELLASAFELLLKGPTDSKDATTIPDGTKLKRVNVKSDGIHINLSQEFKLGGGSAAMTGRLGQVIFTATTLEPNAKVWIAVEGEPLTVLGGEGLIVDQPMTRESFEQNFEL